MEEVLMLRDEVEKLIKDIQPTLRADGGDIELVDVDEDGVVKVRLKGACAGCPMSRMTLELGVERYLKSKIPQVKKVVSVK
jgi:Fe-S cluster biogenesis protein NfuA